MRWLPWNVRYALRALGRSPGFTATVVLTLALGIGATSAVLSAIDTVLLSPLAFPEADRLVQVTQMREGTNQPFIAPIRLEDWNRLSSSFDAITGYYTGDWTDTSGELPERLIAAMVAPRFFDVLGAPGVGRGFTLEEHRTGGTTVVISERLWRRRFGADPVVLDGATRLGSSGPTIVGVVRERAAFPDVDVWFPVPVVDAPIPGTGVESAREYTWYTGVARLAPGVTIEQARADLALVQRRLAEQYPDTDAGIGVAVVPLKETVVASARGSLWLLFGAVSALLAIACTNIGSLLLSRAAEREGDLAVRVSLGAPRAAIVRQLLVETAVLALAGAAAGLLVAAGTLAALRALAPSLPRIDELALDARTVVYALAAAVLVTLACGVGPALRSVRGLASLSRVGRSQVSSRHGLQWGLVGGQVALSVALLAGAGLLIRSYAELARVDPGFDASGVLAFRWSGSYAETADYDRLARRIDAALEGLATLPGVEGVATTAMLPGVPNEFPAELELREGRADAEPRMTAEVRLVAPGYFDVLGVPMLAGELCRPPASGGSLAAAELMVNRSFAEQYLAGRSPLGLHLAAVSGTFAGNFGGPIRGVVGDAREGGLNRAPGPTVYACASASGPTPWFLVRTGGDPLAIVGTVRERLRELEPQRPVYDVAPLERRIGSAYQQNRLRTVLLTLFAGAALSLACLGIYGTLSYVVSLRRREVGLRVALGALHGNIVAQFLGKALRVVAIAVTAGLALSFALRGLLSGMLYGVTPSDPLTLAGVVLAVMTVAALAALLPALRAARVDPMRALREE